MSALKGGSVLGWFVIFQIFPTEEARLSKAWRPWIFFFSLYLCDRFLASPKRVRLFSVEHSLRLIDFEEMLSEVEGARSDVPIISSASSHSDFLPHPSASPISKEERQETERKRKVFEVTEKVGLFVGGQNMRRA